jgi:hypothetical protein
VDEEVLRNTVCQWLQGKDSNFDRVGIHTLAQRWKINVDKNGD